MNNISLLTNILVAITVVLVLVVIYIFLKTPQKLLQKKRKDLLDNHKTNNQTIKNNSNAILNSEADSISDFLRRIDKINNELKFMVNSALYSISLVIVGLSVMTIFIIDNYLKSIIGKGHLSMTKYRKSEEKTLRLKPVKTNKNDLVRETNYDFEGHGEYIALRKNTDSLIIIEYEGKEVALLKSKLTDSITSINIKFKLKIDKINIDKSRKILSVHCSVANISSQKIELITHPNMTQIIEVNGRYFASILRIKDNKITKTVGGNVPGIVNILPNKDVTFTYEFKIPYRTHLYYIKEVHFEINGAMYRQVVNNETHVPPMTVR